MDQAEIDLRFDHHPPETERTVAAHKAVRSIFKTTAIAMSGILDGNRETSLMYTKLEEALMWADASIARHGSLVDLPDYLATIEDDDGDTD